MAKFVSVLSVACLIALLAPSPSSAEGQCAFHDWSHYGETALKKHAGSGAYMFSSGHSAVDADGAPNAYHPDDVGKPCVAQGVGLDCPANAGYPHASWWKNVLVPDPNNDSVAYVQPDGVHKGFFVSKTALFSPTAAKTDTRRYVDARKVAYIVFPGKFYKMKGTGLLGDLGVAYHSKTRRLVPFVVADIGPYKAKLGEASIALFEALGGQAPNPRNGAGIPVGEIKYVLFPYSRKQRQKAWPMTNDELRTRAGALLDSIGGAAVFETCR